jgi:aspartate/tyrosine/aromatic aminotransferase
MFETIAAAPPDPILGLTEAFLNDPNPAKVNLAVGVYQDDAGQTPILESVLRAERLVASREKSKTYLGIAGLPGYAQATQKLLAGAEHEAVRAGRLATCQTPGGTGALRVTADFLAQQYPHSSVWLSRPTWPNHEGIFTAAGLACRQYAYLAPGNRELDFAGMTSDLHKASPLDVVVLHACCHNPSGVDLSPEQWRAVAQIAREKSLIPVVDFAYQGFGDGIEEDALAVRVLIDEGLEFFVCNSFSKNFGLYAERVGAVTAVCDTRNAAAAVLSQLKSAIRTNYSNPPKFGAAIVDAILHSAELRPMWIEEVAAMRTRIHAMRGLFVAKMKERVPQRDFSFLLEQRGMFSFSGLTPLQVDELKSEHGIYIVGSGRINVAAILPSNVDRLCDAVASVLL